MICDIKHGSGGGGQRCLAPPTIIRAQEAAAASVPSSFTSTKDLWNIRELSVRKPDD